MIIFLMCNPDDSGGGQSYESVLLFNNFNFYKALVKIIVAKKIKREKKLVRSQLSIQKKTSSSCTEYLSWVLLCSALSKRCLNDLYL